MELSPENLRARSAPPQPVVADPFTIAPPAVKGRPHALRMPRNHHGCQPCQRAGYHHNFVAVPRALTREPAGADRALQLIDDTGCAPESDVSETGATDPAKDGAPEVLPLAMIPSHWLFRRAPVGVFPVIGQLARVAYYVAFCPMVEALFLIGIESQLAHVHDPGARKMRSGFRSWLTPDHHFRRRECPLS